ncbi:MAG: GSCFA domain-containing protein [Saprospiraceae bacterium]
MENFRTVLKSQPAPFAIGHSDRLLLVGSCFTENIGYRLADFKFPASTNPFGIVYNPASIVRSLERLFAENQFFGEQDIFENAGLWHSWEHHGRFSKPDKTEMLAGLNAAYSEAAAFLKTTNRLLLTFGTADVFALKTTGQIVANNHKMPAALFQERRLSVAEIAETTIAVLQKIKSENADLQVVVTVSPVRHLRGGAVANQRSKATLVLACEEICRQLNFAHYFPAYELLLDDLRDYRFYASDMVHPSEVAVEYIWDFFADTFFSEKTKMLNERIGKITAAACHRPFNPDTAEHRAFARAQLDAIESLKKEWPGLDFSMEATHFQRFA